MLKTAVSIDLVGNLIQQANQNAEAIKRFARVSDQSLARASRAADAVGRSLDTLGNRYTALLASLGVGATVRWVNTWEDQWNMLGLAANASREDIHKLKTEIFAVAQAPDIRINPEGLQEAVETIVEVTGNLDLAQNNLRNIGLLMRSSGATGKDVGAMLSQLYEKAGLRTSEEMLKAIDTLRSQGEAGAFTIRNLSAEGAKLANAFGAMGYRGQSLITQMGAFAQMAMKATGGGAAEASTAIEAMLRDIVAKSGQLEKAGVKVWDQEASRKQGRQVARDAVAIMQDILAKTHGEQVKLRQIFSDEGMRVVNVINADPTKLQQFLGIQADGTEIQKEAAQAATSLTAALTNLHTAWLSFADQNLAGPLQGLADTLNSVEPARMQQLIKGAATVAGVLGALVAARKVQQLASSGIQGIRNLWNGPASSGVSALAGLSVQKVFVTNWPLSMIGTGDSSPLDLFRPGGAAGEAAEAAKPAGRIGRLLARMKGSRIGRLAGRLGGVGRGLARYAGPLLGALAVGGTAYDIWNTMSGEGSADEKRNAVSGAVGQLGGGMAGAQAGALAGSLIMPGVGTVVGGLAGGALGAFGGKELLQWLSNRFDEPQKTELQGRLAVEFVGAPAPLRVRAADSSPGVELDVDTGLMMGWP